MQCPREKMHPSPRSHTHHRVTWFSRRMAGDRSRRERAPRPLCLHRARLRPFLAHKPTHWARLTDWLRVASKRERKTHLGMGRTAADWHHSTADSEHMERRRRRITQRYRAHWCLGLGIRTPNSQMCNKNNKEKKGARCGPTDFCFSTRRSAKIAITQNKCATWTSE